MILKFQIFQLRYSLLHKRWWLYRQISEIKFNTGIWADEYDKELKKL
ncbi:hypothetical protein LCGC14_2248720 [marine sediment metagenome]|uniref:Uncharacterized protein n=1 Tax=marine sediment metagenome TaxID=412755 RepID=A0A0F9FFS6_9ZZZZ